MSWIFACGHVLARKWKVLLWLLLLNHSLLTFLTGWGGQKSLFSKFALKIIFMLNYVSGSLKDICLTLSDMLKKPEKSEVTEVNFLQKVMIFDIFCNFFAFSSKRLTFDSCRWWNKRSGVLKYVYNFKGNYMKKSLKMKIFEKNCQKKSKKCGILVSFIFSSNRDRYVL